MKTLKKIFLLGLCSLWNISCNSNDTIVETIQVNDLTIIKTEYFKTKNVTLEFFEKDKKNTMYRYGEGFTLCDTTKAFRNKINEYPSEIEMFDEQDSLIAKIECLKIGESISGKSGKKFIYDCNRIEYDPERRVKGGFDYGPGYTKKAIKYVGHFKINKDCNGLARTPVSENEYDFEREKVEKKNYNINGEIESISYYVYPQREIYEKKLYIDGEYIKTKCFKNDSLGTKDEEFVDEKKHCYNIEVDVMRRQGRMMNNYIKKMDSLYRDNNLESWSKRSDWYNNDKYENYYIK